MTRRNKILIAIAATVAVVAVFAAWQGVRAYLAWNSIERVEFDLDDARAALGTAPAVTAEQTDPTATTSTAPSLPPTTYQSVLVIGSDKKPKKDQIAEFADAVALYLLPDDGSAPLFVSLPRDLMVRNPCSGALTKLDRTLEGCGDAVGGPELVALTVEDFTGIPIDHFAMLRFEALIEMVDAVGGVEICVPHALREGTLDIVPAGCSTIDGKHALAYIRSRKTQELVDGEWRFQEDTGDAARIARQQDLLFALLDALKGVRSPTELAGLAEQLGDTIVLSETLGLGDAVAMAWDLRSLSGSAIRTVTVPTESAVLPDGSFAVRATVPFTALLES